MRAEMFKCRNQSDNHLNGLLNPISCQGPPVGARCSRCRRCRWSPTLELRYCSRDDSRLLQQVKECVSFGYRCFKQTPIQEIHVRTNAGPHRRTVRIFERCWLQCEERPLPLSTPGKQDCESELKSNLKRLNDKSNVSLSELHA